MITHMVMFRLQDPAEAPRLAQLLNDLNGRIPGMHSMSAGANVVVSDRAFDLGLVSVHDDMAALDAYRDHPAHVAVAEQIAALRTEAAAVDFSS